MLIVVLLPLLYSPVWFAASLYDTVWIGFVSKALLVLFICLTLLFRSSPKSSSGPFVTFFANCFIQPGNFGLIMFLLNWLVGLAACARKARAFISGVRNSLLRSILYLTNHPITILAIFILKGVSSFFFEDNFSDILPPNFSLFKGILLFPSGVPVYNSWISSAKFCWSGMMHSS